MDARTMLIVVCQHGDEPVGLEVEQLLGSDFDVLIAHPEAVERRVRFLESDLNRSFPGRKDGTLEESLAIDVLDRARTYGLVIDVHTTTSRVDLFGIAARSDPRIIALAQRMGLSRLVVMPENLASRSLIGNVPLGMSLEVGPHERAENATGIVQAIRSLTTAEPAEGEVEVYEVFDAIRGEGTSMMENFVFVSEGVVIGSNGSEALRAPFDFYPVLVGEAAYAEQLALAARKSSISRNV